MTRTIESGKDIVSKGFGDLSVDIGTYVIIHSGVYYNVVGGGTASVGSESKSLSTYLVMKGGTIVDTLVGGCGGSATVYGSSTNTATVSQGGTFVYGINLYMTGDVWETTELGYTKTYGNTESSILEGGGSSGAVRGSTHVMLTGTSSVWDAQAGGRRGGTSAYFAAMEISGKAVVRHIACGTITDGNYKSNDRNAVNGVSISTYDDCKVGMLFGAGYDTWYYPTYKSMTSGVINVDINGGTIGYVYGGGYRGSIGQSTGTSVTVNVNINGGEVLRDVFGGGRGGVDKILHSASGGLSGDSQYNKPMGRSYVYGTVNVTVSGGVVDGNVYGGGESIPRLKSIGSRNFNGTEDDGSGMADHVASVIGNVTVTVQDDAIIRGNVYGAGKGVLFNSDGNVTGDYTTSYVVNSRGEFRDLPWYVHSETPEYYNTDADTNYYEFAKVNGNVTLNIAGGQIDGDAYGGGAYGKVYGNINVNVSGGNITGNLYGGGVGYEGRTAVSGTRTISFKDATLGGSLYGGTAFGDDGVSTSTTSSVNIYMESGTITGSIFGGGFKGNTYGDVTIRIGYNALTGAELAGHTGSITLEQSIYIGGDVGELGPGVQPYTNYLVHGKGALYIDGAYNHIAMHGSIMGSGNACLTKGETQITLAYVENSVPMEAIHRADKVEIIGSFLELNGRSTVDAHAADSLYTLFMIKTLDLVNTSVLTLNNPVGEVGTYRSLNKDGNETTPTSPSNKIIIGSGNSLIINASSNHPSPYGLVKGYTILSINTSESGFGGYAIGSTASTGGFVINNKGSFVKADSTDLTDCRCWFIAGTQSSSLAVTLDYKAGSTTTQSADIMLTKLMSETAIRYTGGTFISSNVEAYHVVDPTKTVNDNDGVFNVLVGKNVTGSSIHFGTGKYLDGAYTSDSVEGTITTPGLKDPVLNVEVTGKFVNASQYIGYVVIYLQEVSSITYTNSAGESETAYILTNSIQITIEIYTQGTSALPIGQALSLGTVGGDGTADFMAPSKLTGYSLYITGVTNTHPESTATLYAEAMKNFNNTPGWTNMYGSFEISPETIQAADNHRILVGVMNGGYVARLNFHITGFDLESDTYVLTLQLYDGTSFKDPFHITLNVNPISDVTVTFIDTSQDSVLEVEYPYGTVLTEAVCPPTLPNFIGWYYPPVDGQFITAYSFSTPVTVPITLYARYMLVVTFDNMDGTSSQMYVAENEGGTLIEPPENPTRDGYNFDVWCKEPKCITQWNFATERVTDSITLYARWDGYDITVKFAYEGTELSYTAEVSYGSVFGVLDEDASIEAGEDITILAQAQKILEESGLLGEKVFIRWQIPLVVAGSDVKYVPVYDDTIVNTYNKVGSEYYITLQAMTSAVAVRVTMDSNTRDLTSEVVAPATFLVFPTTDQINDDGKGTTWWDFTFTLNDATRSGWLLLGWSTDPGASASDPSSYSASGSVLTLSKYCTKNGVVQEEGGIPVADLLADVDDPYTVTYYAVWKQIPYTVKIMESAHGTVDAFYNSESRSEFTAYYGDRVVLKFTPDAGYTLAKWIISGEGTIAESEINKSSATLVVVGDCSIYASTIGPQIVQLYATFNGGAMLDLPPNAVLSTDGVNVDVEFAAPIWNHERNCHQYQCIADTGTYYVCLVGDDGTLYRFGTVTVSTTGNSCTLNAITVTNEIVDEDGGVKAYTQYVEPGNDVNITISAGHNYDVSYAIGTGAPVQLDSSVAKDVDTNLSFNVPADNVQGITLSGTVTAVHYVLNQHLVFDREYRGGLSFNSDYGPYDLKYGTLMSDILLKEGDIHSTNDPSKTYASEKYAIVGWYTSYADDVFHNPLPATKRFDSTLINDTGTLDVYAWVIDILYEYPVPVHEKEQGVDGEYTDITVGVMAHAIPSEDSATETIYEGTYILGGYSSFPYRLYFYDSVHECELVDCYTLDGSELSFRVPFGTVLTIYYDRPLTALTYDIGNGEFTSTPLSSAYFEQVVTLPSVEPPERYLFDSWVLVTGTGVLHTFGGNQDYTVTMEDCRAGTVAFRAVYVPISAYTLTLITENGTFSNGYSRISMLVGVDESLSTYIQIPSVSDDSPYEFDGWSPATADVMPNHDLVYTAKWTARNFTLNYTGIPIMEDGQLVDRVIISATSDSTEFASGSSIPYGTNVTLTILFSPNYSLGSYYPGSDVIGTAPVEGASSQEFVWSFFLTQNTNIEITPAWAGLEIYFVINDQLDPSLTLAAQKYSNVYFDDFSRPGYSNAHWYLDNTYTPGSEVGRAVDPSTGTERYVLAKVIRPVTVYSNPVPNNYTVNFMDGSTLLGSNVMTYDLAQALSCPAPESPGKIFLGWSFNSKYYLPSDTVLNLTTEKDGIVTFNAVWATINSGDSKYDGAEHAGTITGSKVTPYYGTKNLTASNYRTDGQLAPITNVPAGTYRTYYYFVMTSDVTGKTLGLSGSFNTVISKRVVTFTSGSAEKTYDELPLVNPRVIVSGDGLAVTDVDEVTYDFTGSSITSVGSCENIFTISWGSLSPAVRASYEYTVVYGTLTINPASANIDVNPTSYEVTYGCGPVQINATAKGGHSAPLVYTSSDESILRVSDTGLVTVVGAGSANIIIDLDSSEVEANPATVSFTVAPKVLSVNHSYSAGVTKVYDATNTVLEDLVFGLAGVVGSDVVSLNATYAYNGVHARDDLLINVLCTLGGADAGNYLVNNFTIPGKITARPVTITSGTSEKVFDNTPLTDGTVTITSGSLAGEDAFTTLRTTGTITAVGQVPNTIEYVLKGTATDYDITLDPGTLTVTVLMIPVPESHSVEYTGKVISASNAFSTSTYSRYYSISGSGTEVRAEPYVATLNLTYPGSSMWAVGAGTTAPQYVEWRIVNAVLKAEDFNVDLTNVVYKGAPWDDKFLGPVDPTKFQDGDYEVRYLNNVNAGSATLRVVGTGGYAGQVDYTFIIEPKPLSVFLENTRVKYDGQAHYIDFTTSGKVGEDVIALRCNGDGKIAVGEYTVTLLSISNPNYKLADDSVRSAVLTIESNSVIIVASSAMTSIDVSQSIVLSDTDYTLFGLSAQDLEVFKTLYVIRVNGVQNGVGTSFSQVTCEPIDPADASRYDIILVPGIITISKTGYSSVIIC